MQCLENIHQRNSGAKLQPGLQESQRQFKSRPQRPKRTTERD